MKFILNAFSLSMVSAPANINVREVSAELAASLSQDAESAVGHKETASVFSSVLGRTVDVNRATVSLQSGDSVLVGQYTGPRLAEGATMLPSDAVIKWLVVTVS